MIAMAAAEGPGSSSDETVKVTSSPKPELRQVRLGGGGGSEQFIPVPQYELEDASSTLMRFSLELSS